VFHTRVDPDSGLATKFLRTGDLAIRSADGVLEFLGRRDRQIKLRGHRIELDEIESQLLNHPQIFQAAAMLIKNDGASAPSPRIIAAVIPADSANGISEKHIKQFIGERLPRYAMPDSVHICNEFPRTGSDKIDRLTLAAALTSAAAH
jgi:acyl-coenzyme A synthetase/AMP-(fatty) acid ligase